MRIDRAAKSTLFCGMVGVQLADVRVIEKVEERFLIRNPQRCHDRYYVGWRERLSS